MNGIYHDLVINCSIEELYATISTPKGLNIWWTKSSEGEAAMGNTYRFYFAPEYDWYGEVIGLSETHISYRMTQADEDWTGTEISFRIISENEGKQLMRFEHIKWKEINDHFRTTSFCWASYLTTMKTYLEH